MSSSDTFEHTLPGVGYLRRHPRHPRHKVVVNVLVMPLDERIAPFWATSDDLSLRGVFIDASRQLPIGLMVLLKIVARDRPALRIKAQVVHRLASAGFGCRFLAPGPAASTRLRQLLLHATDRGSLADN